MDTFELVGYFASVMIAVSMTLNSIVNFRWVNFIGAVSFAIYGVLIDALPVLLLNGFIALTDIYYLVKIYSKKELFTTMKVQGANEFLQSFLKFHDAEIQKFFPGFSFKSDLNTLSFFVLRNMNVAGIFLAYKVDSKTLKVALDYVIPQYRDYKNARFVYERLNVRFINEGIEKIIVYPQSYKHVKYLNKIGFEKQEDGNYFKNITA